MRRMCKVRYSLAGYDSRPSPERPGLESRWRNIFEGPSRAKTGPIIETGHGKKGARPRRDALAAERRGPAGGRGRQGRQGRAPSGMTPCRKRRQSDRASGLRLLSRSGKVSWKTRGIGLAALLRTSACRPPWGKPCARGRALLSRVHALRRALLPQRLAHPPQARRASSAPIRDSAVASAPACRAEDPGSIPGRRAMHRCALETTHSPREARKKRIVALTSSAHCPPDLRGASDVSSAPSPVGRAQGP